ncbi:MAG: hypothetical protein ACM3WV_01230 [Bacillota bacterium]
MVLRDDTAINLSEELYLEYVKPYDEKILDEFGGGCIHFRGHGRQWLAEMMKSKGLYGINFGQPPQLKFGLDFLAEIHPVFTGGI